MLCEKCTALLEENRRMREALERLIIEAEESIDLPQLAMAIQLAQHALKGDK